MIFKFCLKLVFHLEINRLNENIFNLLFLKRLMILFRVNNSEYLGLKDTGGTNKLFPADFLSFFVFFSTSIEFNFNIFLDWSLDNKLLTLDLESKSRGTL